MRRLCCLVVLAAALLGARVPAVPAQTPAAAIPHVGPVADPLASYRLLIGDWAGTLTYADYQDDSTRVELGVRVAVAEARDSTGAAALRFAYAYTEPDGRAVDGGTDVFVPGSDPSRFRFGDAEWAVAERVTTGGRLRLVFARESRDNDRPATVRETLTAGPDGWTLLKEVRYAGTDRFFERHTYRLQAVSSGSGRIPGAALRTDVAVLRRAYEALHPGLNRYRTPAEMNARFDALDARVSAGLTLQETYLALAAFLNTVQCGHTFPNPANQSDAVTAAVVTAGRRLPFAFRWLDRRMVVTRDLSPDRRLRPGTEVLAVDGVPTDSILARLLPLSRADGGNDAKRVANLEVHGMGRYEAFDVYFPLVFPLGETAVLTVREPLGGGEQTVPVVTMDHARREAIRAADAATSPAASGVGWTFDALDDSTALLRMPSWATYNESWDWRAFVDRTFDTLVERGTSLLVVDLRGNEGGESVGDAILSRLVARDLSLASFERFVRYRRVPADLRPYLDTWDRSFDDWSASTTVERDGLYRMTRYDDGPEGTVVRPSGRRFTGRVAVLVGAANSSATFGFARDVQENGLGTLVGQTTGGNQRGINGGAFYFLRLPHTGIEVDLPLIGFFPLAGAETPPDAGLQPDVAVVPRADDLARGVDPELEAARRLPR